MVKESTLQYIEFVMLAFMDTQWDFTDLYGLPRSINITRDLEFNYTFKWDNSKTRFGSCQLKGSQRMGYERIITLSKPLCLCNLDKIDTEIENVILHEIAHALTIAINPHVDSHGDLWQHIAKQIGCNAERCFNKNIASPPSKYSLTCPSCSHVFAGYKKKKRRSSCSHCSGGSFKIEFLLIETLNY